VSATHLSFAGLVYLFGALCGLGCKSEHAGTQDAGTSPNPGVLRPVPESGHLVFRPAPESPVEPSSDTAAQLVVSGSRIGPIPVDSSMGYIARLLPAYAVDSGYLETTRIIGWDFTIRGFSVWATQQHADMNPDHPAYSWVISGSGTVRLGDSVLLRLPTVWRDVRKRLSGRAEIESGELGTRATFCGLPQVAFPLDVGSGEQGGGIPPDSVAPSTIISRIEVWREDATGRCVA
jgi:hypothetical protein